MKIKQDMSAEPCGDWIPSKDNDSFGRFLLENISDKIPIGLQLFYNKKNSGKYIEIDIIQKSKEDK